MKGFDAADYEYIGYQQDDLPHGRGVMHFEQEQYHVLHYKGFIFFMFRIRDYEGLLMRKVLNAFYNKWMYAAML